LQGRPELLAAVTVAIFMCGLPLTLLGLVGGATLAARGLALQALADVYLGTGFIYLLLALPAALSTFFTDRALLLLALTPMRPEQIFAARLIPSFRVSLVVLWPVLTLSLGVGIGARAGPVYFAAALLVAAIWPLMLTAAQVGLLSVVLRVVPPAYVRGATIGVSMLLVLAAWSVQLTTIGRDPRAMDQLGGMSGDASWLPVARGLAGLAIGPQSEAVRWIPVTLAAMAVIVLAAGLAYRSALQAGVGAGVLAPAPIRRRGRERTAHSNAAAAPMVAMVRKDWLLFRRDPRRLLQAVPLVAFAWPLWRINSVSSSAQAVPGIFWLNLTVLGLLPFMFSSVFGLFAVSAEKAGFQLLRLVPRTAAWVLRAKLCFALPPILTLTIAATALVLSLAGSTAWQMAVALLVMGWLAAGLGTMAVAAGAIWPNLTSGGGGQPLEIGGSIAVLFLDAAFWMLTAAGIALVTVAFGIGLPLRGTIALALLGWLALAGAAAIPTGMLELGRRSILRHEPAPPA
jgi:hypothetical protein